MPLNTSSRILTTIDEHEMAADEVKREMDVRTADCFIWLKYQLCLRYSIRETHRWEILNIKHHSSDHLISRESDEFDVLSRDWDARLFWRRFTGADGEKPQRFRNPKSIYRGQRNPYENTRLMKVRDEERTGTLGRGRLFSCLDSGWVFGSAEWNVSVYYGKIFAKRPTSSAGPQPDAHSCFCLSIPLARRKRKEHEVIHCYRSSPASFSQTGWQVSRGQNLTRQDVCEAHLHTQLFTSYHHLHTLTSSFKLRKRKEECFLCASKYNFSNQSVQLREISIHISHCIILLSCFYLIIFEPSISSSSLVLHGKMKQQERVFNGDAVPLRIWDTHLI